MTCFLKPAGVGLLALAIAGELTARIAPPNAAAITARDTVKVKVIVYSFCDVFGGRGVL